jgi:hypothetical protein
MMLVPTIALVACSAAISTPQSTNTNHLPVTTPTLPAETSRPTKTATPDLIKTETAFSKDNFGANLTGTARTLATPIPATPTITPLPFYPTKQVIFDYNVIGDHSVYDGFFDPNFFRPWSKFVLYADGQIIITGTTYQQKILSPDEIKQFLSRLEAAGFYSLESNQKHDPTDKLYDYGNNYQESSDGLEYCILVNTVKSRNLCVYEPDIQFVVPKMKNILQFLDDYKPAGMTPYYPDRILLWVQPGRDPYNNQLPKDALHWGESFPSLETPDSKVIYVDGAAAKEIYMLFDRSPNLGKVFSQNDKEYTVYFNVVLPHEQVTNAYQ